MQTKETRLKLATEILQNILNGGHSQQILTEALSLVQKIISNIAKNPAEQKFKTIKLDNVTLKNKLFTIHEISVLLESLGFVLVESEYHYLEDEFFHLKVFSSMIIQEIDSLSEQKTTPMLQTKKPSAYEIECQKRKEYEDRVKRSVEEDREFKAQFQNKPPEMGKISKLKPANDEEYQKKAAYEAKVKQSIVEDREFKQQFGSSGSKTMTMVQPEKKLSDYEKEMQRKRDYEEKVKRDIETDKKEREESIRRSNDSYRNDLNFGRKEKKILPISHEEDKNPTLIPSA